MVRRLAAISASFALLVGAAVGQAAETKGEVVQHDTAGKMLSVQTDDGERVTFRLDDDTKIEKDGETSSLSPLPAGTTVTVESAQDPADTTGHVAATRIEIEDAPGMRPSEGGMPPAPTGVRPGDHPTIPPAGVGEPR